MKKELHYNWAPLSSKAVKWAGIDFDETIATNSGFPNYTPGKPIKHAVKYVRKLHAMGYKITIFTARAWVDYNNIESYCKHYGIPVRRIICGKPLLRFLIDDKGIEFDGDWEKSFKKAIKL